jgi:hypothetical protein
MIRFWSKTRKRKNGCREWTAAKFKDTPYGAFWYEGQMRYAHVFSWFLKTGKWPTLYVLHKCDNHACVEWDHLFEGTLSDNSVDMVRKGRQRGGFTLAQRIQNGTVTA